MHRFRLENELKSLTAVQAAERLIGCELVRQIDRQSILSGIIVETEAYDETDQASHSYRGRTIRNSVMFGLPARAYIYFTYGMHHCLNVVVGQEGSGSAVLIRAIEPLAGVSLMIQNRGISQIDKLCNGPTKICQAMNINRQLNGQALDRLPLMIKLKPAIEPQLISWTPRIGIKERSTEVLAWRACLSSSDYLSRPISSASKT